MNPFPADMSFDKLLELDPRIRDWLAAGVVKASTKFTKTSPSIANVNSNWQTFNYGNLTELALRNLCTNIVFKDVANNLQDPNFKYYIDIVIINPRAPNEQAAFLWQNVDITRQNN